MDLLAFFLSQHAAVHSSEVSGHGAFAQRVFSGLTDEQVRIQPGKGLNSLV